MGDFEVIMTQPIPLISGQQREMYVVANNNPGHGEHYMEMRGYHAFDPDNNDMGTVGYDYTLCHYDGRELVDIDDDDDPAALLHHVPPHWQPVMKDQIDRFFANELPGLLDGTRAWHEVYPDEGA